MHLSKNADSAAPIAIAYAIYHSALGAIFFMNAIQITTSTHKQTIVKKTVFGVTTAFLLLISSLTADGHILLDIENPSLILCVYRCATLGY